MVAPGPVGGRSSKRGRAADQWRVGACHALGTFLRTKAGPGCETQHPRPSEACTPAPGKLLEEEPTHKSPRPPPPVSFFSTPRETTTNK